jgi:hypothetical protein
MHSVTVVELNYLELVENSIRVIFSNQQRDEDGNWHLTTHYSRTRENQIRTGPMRVVIHQREALAMARQFLSFCHLLSKTTPCAIPYLHVSTASFVVRRLLVPHAH